MVSILFNSIALHDIWMDPYEEAPESLSPTLALSPVLVPGSLDSYTPNDGSSSVAAFVELDGKAKYMLFFTNVHYRTLCFRTFGLYVQTGYHDTMTADFGQSKYANK